jgi:cellulose synthase/poly-beta-1,6-N-acetylglucosamine synthase-like glycosyltransferase
MKLLFWSSFTLIFLTYAGYPICLYLWARFRPRPIRQATIFPSVTILLAVRNEATKLPSKLRNLAELDYPPDRLEIIVVSDGSMDETNEILAAWEKPHRQAVILAKHRGKAEALNRGVAQAGGEIIVFTDARQIITSDALKNLVSNFADPSVGCASGELIIAESSTGTSAEGVSLYWRMEKNIRHWEGLTGSTVGATGAFYAVRRHLIAHVPPETILDDVYIPLQVIKQGHRVVFERSAHAQDDLKPTARQEFHRKVRTLVGNYQLLELASWVVTRSNPVRLQFVCHKLLRLLMPFALMGLLVSTMWLRRDIYALALGVQLIFYGLATLSVFRVPYGIISRVSQISLAFLVLNTAAAVALAYFITGRKAVWMS